MPRELECSVGCIESIQKTLDSRASKTAHSIADDLSENMHCVLHKFIAGVRLLRDVMLLSSRGLNEEEITIHKSRNG